MYQIYTQQLAFATAVGLLLGGCAYQEGSDSASPMVVTALRESLEISEVSTFEPVEITDLLEVGEGEMIEPSDLRESQGVGDPPTTKPSAVTTSPPVGNGRRYERIEAGPGGIYAKHTICDRVGQGQSVFGVYTVRSLRGATETAPEGDAMGVTYVELERVDGDGPAAPVARIPGGPLPNGRYFPGPIALAVGDVLGLVLRPSTVEGFYTFEPPDVFRPAGKGRTKNLNQHVEVPIGQFVRWAREQTRSGCLAKGRKNAPKPKSLHQLPAKARDVVDYEVFGVENPLGP